MTNTFFTKIKTLNFKKITSVLLVIGILFYSNPFGVFDSKETKRIKTILKNNTIVNNAIIDQVYASEFSDKEIKNMETENAEYLKNIDTINFEICALKSQIGNEYIDFSIKCNIDDVEKIKNEKKDVANSENNNKSNINKGYGYDENGNKMKWMMTRYYSTDYNQEYFKYSDKRTSAGRVKWAGKFVPANDTERWNAYMSDSLVQCGTPYSQKPDETNMKSKLEQLSHACGTPGITPFVDLNGKSNVYFEPEHAYKVIACDYKYISKIAKLDCSPTILNSTKPKSKEWNDALACRNQINKDITFKIEGIGEAKCADAGNAINGAHLDVWAGYGNEALKELAKGNMLNLHTSNYNIGLDGKKGADREGFWADVEIFNKGVKVY